MNETGPADLPRDPLVDLDELRDLAGMVTELATRAFSEGVTLALAARRAGIRPTPPALWVGSKTQKALQRLQRSSQPAAAAVEPESEGGDD